MGVPTTQSNHPGHTEAKHGRVGVRPRKHTHSRSRTRAPWSRLQFMRAARGGVVSRRGTGFGTRHTRRDPAYGTSFDLNGKNDYRITVHTVFVTSARNAVVRGCHAHGRARAKLYVCYMYEDRCRQLRFAIPLAAPLWGGAGPRAAGRTRCAQATGSALAG